MRHNLLTRIGSTAGLGLTLWMSSLTGCNTELETFTDAQTAKTVSEDTTLDNSFTYREIGKRPRVDQFLLEQLNTDDAPTVDVGLFLSTRSATSTGDATYASGTVDRNGKLIEGELNGTPVDLEGFAAHADALKSALNLKAVAKIEERKAAWKKLAEQYGLEEALATPIEQGPSSFELNLPKEIARKITLNDTGILRQISRVTAGRTSLDSALDSVGISTVAFPSGWDGTDQGIFLTDFNGPDTTMACIDNDRLTIAEGTLSDINDHATLMACILQAAAPEAQILYRTAYGACGSDIPQEALEFSPAINVSSQSDNWEGSGDYTACDGNFDDRIVDTGIAHFNSTGNHGTYVASPSAAYNVISIGNYSDEAVPNFVVPGSAYLDPETGAKKPDLVGPGVDVDVPPSYVGTGGTSVSTPIVAAFSADLMEEYPFLERHPQLLKAYLMANAVRVGSDGTIIGSRDGAGRPDFTNAQYGRWYWWEGANDAFFEQDSDLDGQEDLTVSYDLTEGHAYNVVLSFLVDGTYVSTNLTPNMDINLDVIAPDGTIWTSDSEDHNVEAIQFTAPESGEYVFRIERVWNSGVGPVRMGMVIRERALEVPALAVITTNELLDDPASLIRAYAAFKRQTQPTVIVTENETYLSNGTELSSGWAGGVDLTQTPSRESADERADAIRAWLKSNYGTLGIKNVLFIGNPSPDGGDVPMKNFFAYKTHTDPLELDVPTDYYYSNLTYDWPVDSDGQILPSVNDDLGYQDVNVGRLPVYNDNIEMMNKVLNKFIAYASSTDTAWRRNALVVMNRHFPDRPGDYVPTGEATVNNILIPNGFDYYRVYDPYTPPGCTDESCVISGERPLYSPIDVGSVWARGAWAGCQGGICSQPKENFGVVFWSAHGGDTGASNVIELTNPAYDYSEELDDTHPAFTVTLSCRNSVPFNSNNLGSALLNNGSIAVLGASRYAWPGGADWADPYVDTAASTDVGFGFVMELIAGGMPAGEALSAVRTYLWENVISLMPNTDGLKLGWMGQQMLFNLYGDPTIGLKNVQNSSVVTLPSDTPTNVTVDAGETVTLFADNWPSKGNPWWTANVVLAVNSLSGRPAPSGTIRVNGVAYSFGGSYYQEINISDKGPYTIEISASAAASLQITLGNR